MCLLLSMSITLLQDPMSYNNTSQSCDESSLSCVESLLNNLLAPTGSFFISNSCRVRHLIPPIPVSLSAIRSPDQIPFTTSPYWTDITEPVHHLFAILP